MNQLSRQLGQPTQTTGLWLAARWCLIGLVLMLFWSNVAQAGCQHAGAGSVDRQHTSQLAVDSALLGRWQYAAGEVFYIFHPLPQPCDGPNCHQSPGPSSEMSVIPSTTERIPSVGSEKSMSLSEKPIVTCDAIPSTISMVASPMLDGILRPPCAAKLK